MLHLTVAQLLRLSLPLLLLQSLPHPLYSVSIASVVAYASSSAASADAALSRCSLTNFSSFMVKWHCGISSSSALGASAALCGIRGRHNGSCAWPPIIRTSCNCPRNRHSVTRCLSRCRAADQAALQVTLPSTCLLLALPCLVLPCPGSSRQQHQC